MANNTCRAKDPSTCWKHGTQQGVVALKKIQKAIANPEMRYFLTEEQRAEKPLKDLTATGLSLAILDFARKTPGIDELKVQNAILVAANLHQGDNRTNRGRYDKTPYIEHPLRNTLRAIRYGTTSEAVILGSIFHDTVEDHPFEISEQYTRKVASDEDDARKNSYRWLENTYGTSTRKMVEGMSNPITVDKYTPSVKKNAIYAEHVKEEIEDPNVAVGKTCDFVDNAVGLFHNAKGGMSKISYQKKATKYLPVCDIIEARLERAKSEPNFPVSKEGIERMIKHIQDGRKSLKDLLSH